MMRRVTVKKVSFARRNLRYGSGLGANSRRIKVHTAPFSTLKRGNQSELACGTLHSSSWRCMSTETVSKGVQSEGKAETTASSGTENTSNNDGNGTSEHNKKGKSRGKGSLVGMTVGALASVVGGSYYMYSNDVTQVADRGHRVAVSVAEEHFFVPDLVRNFIHQAQSRQMSEVLRALNVSEEIKSATEQQEAPGPSENEQHENGETTAQSSVTSAVVEETKAVRVQGLPGSGRRAFKNNAIAELRKRNRHVVEIPSVSKMESRTVVVPAVCSPLHRLLRAVYAVLWIPEARAYINTVRQSYNSTDISSANYLHRTLLSLNAIYVARVYIEALDELVERSKSGEAHAKPTLVVCTTDHLHRLRERLDTHSSSSKFVVSDNPTVLEGVVSDLVHFNETSSNLSAAALVDAALRQVSSTSLQKNRANLVHFVLDGPEQPLLRGVERQKWATVIDLSFVHKNTRFEALFDTINAYGSNQFEKLSGHTACLDKQFIDSIVSLVRETCGTRTADIAAWLKRFDRHLSNMAEELAKENRHPTLEKDTVDLVKDHVTKASERALEEIVDCVSASVADFLHVPSVDLSSDVEVLSDLRRIHMSVDGKAEPVPKSSLPANSEIAAFSVTAFHTLCTLANLSDSVGPTGLPYRQSKNNLRFKYSNLLQSVSEKAPRKGDVAFVQPYVQLLLAAQLIEPAKMYCSLPGCEESISGQSDSAPSEAHEVTELDPVVRIRSLLRAAVQHLVDKDKFARKFLEYRTIRLQLQGEFKEAEEDFKDIHEEEQKIEELEKELHSKEQNGTIPEEEARNSRINIQLLRDKVDVRKREVKSRLEKLEEREKWLEREHNKLRTELKDAKAEA
eukprot:gb/GECG01013784.1/.p1 GENE.gb/GECG01013784.1/~~gb/GECG01013784.1/.p1  ORF type:complete len:851 (+),score=122.45 gb/GECG01013784.1/:1-2553(+)